MERDRRAIGFDAEAALSDPGFTPGKQHLPALFDLLDSAEEELALRVERALSRSAGAALAEALSRYRRAGAPLRRRLIRLLARIGLTEHSELVAHFLSALGDADPVVRRWAVRGLGQVKAPNATVEAALLEAWALADLPLQRALAEALGKVGGERSLAQLSRSFEDSELDRRARRAVLMIDRGVTRRAPSRIRLDAPLGARELVVARSRAGLSELVADELSPYGARAVSRAAVELEFSGTLAELLRARMPLDFAVRVLPRGRAPEGARGVAELVTSPAALRVFGAWTEGQVRFRLSFAAGGHRRAEVWKIAELVAARSREVVNDSRDAPWEVVVGARPERDGIWLVPRGYDDPRFAYRTRDVPAASHPTLAAALARVAGARAEDVVWDPFVGSGLELVERARLGPYRRLFGSDVDPRALEAARENLNSAGIERFELVRGDARSLSPRGVTLLVTNPPMGRRVARDGSIGDLLSSFVRHAARVLVPGGRLVWLTPLPELTRDVSQAAGLTVERIAVVDMQGFDASLCVLRHRSGQ